MMANKPQRSEKLCALKNYFDTSLTGRTKKRKNKKMIKTPKFCAEDDQKSH